MNVWPLTFDISPSGVLTLPVETPSFFGVLNQAKDILVSTFTGSPFDHPSLNGLNLLVSVKTGNTSFATSDLEGEWNFHSLISPPSPESGGWTYGTITLDSSGTGTATEIESSGGTLNETISFSINTDGVVGIPGEQSIHGIMSPDKNTFVVTGDHDPGSYVFIIIQRSGSSFLQSDLQGIHRYLQLTSDDSSQGKWEHGVETIDSDGNGTLISFLDSNGDTIAGDTFTALINSNGIITLPFEDGTFHGSISLDKSMFVGTFDEGTPFFDLHIALK